MPISMSQEYCGATFHGIKPKSRMVCVSSTGLQRTWDPEIRKGETAAQPLSTQGPQSQVIAKNHPGLVRPCPGSDTGDQISSMIS